MGRLLPFSRREAAVDGVSSPAATTLAVLDVSSAGGSPSSPVSPTFSNLRDVVSGFSSPQGNLVAWPSFAPDGKVVVFQGVSKVTTEQRFGSPANARANLFAVNTGLNGAAPVRLNALGGLTSCIATTFLNVTYPRTKTIRKSCG